MLELRRTWTGLVLLLAAGAGAGMGAETLIGPALSQPPGFEEAGDALAEAWADADLHTAAVLDYKVIDSDLYVDGVFKPYALNTWGFGFTSYSKELPRTGEFPLSLQPLIKRPSSATVLVGTGTFTYEGTPRPSGYFLADLTFMSHKQFGARMFYERVQAITKEVGLMTTGLSLMYDYRRGGRISLDLKDQGLEQSVPPDVLCESWSERGLSWTHLWSVLESGAVKLDYSLSLRDYEKPGAGKARSGKHEITLTAYPSAHFGFALIGAADRGDQGNTGALGGKLIADLEQIGLEIEFRRRNRIADGLGTQDWLLARIELRF